MPRPRKEKEPDEAPETAIAPVQGATGVPAGPVEAPSPVLGQGSVPGPTVSPSTLDLVQNVDGAKVPALVPTDPNRPKRAGRRSKEEIDRERLHRESIERARLEAEQKLLREAALTRAHAAGTFLVKLIDKIVSRWLPPALNKEEQAELAEAAAPVLMLYDADFMGSPWFGLAITAAAIYLPRWNEKEQRKVPMLQAPPNVVRGP